MSNLPKDKLDRLVLRWDQIQAELNQGVAQAAYAKLNKEFSDLDPVVRKIRDLDRAEQDVA
ncbi:MAG: peptide chain release factor 1, partial [Hyphomicrobium sp.]